MNNLHTENINLYHRELVLRNNINNTISLQLEANNHTNQLSLSNHRHIVSFNPSYLTFKEEISLMMYKHYKIYSRNLKSLLFIFLAPIFFLSLLQAMQYLTDNYKNRSVILEPKIINLDDVTLDCHANLNMTNCVSLGIGVIGNITEQENNDVRRLISTLENKTNLSLAKGEIELLQLNYSNQNELYQIFDNKNKLYQFVLSICYGSFELGDISVPCKPDYANDFYLYTIIYNISNTPNAFLSGYNSPYPTDDKLVKLKHIIDNSYIELFHHKYKGKMLNVNNSTIPQIKNISIQSYPSTPSRLMQGASIISTFGSFYLFFPPMILFSILLLDIVKEKESKLKHYTILNGMSLFSYWASWGIVAMVLSFLLTSEILSLGIFIFHYDIFTNVNIFISFTLFFMFLLSLQFLSMMLSNYVSSLSGATTMSYFVIIVGIVIQTILTNYTIMYFLYAVNVDILWLKILLKGLSLFMHFYPPFIFTKCFVDIVSISSSHFDYDLFQWIPGRFYSFVDMFQEYRGKLLIGIEYKIDSMFDTCVWFYISIVFYILVISLKEIRDYYAEMKNHLDENTFNEMTTRLSKYYRSSYYYYKIDYYHDIVVEIITKYLPKIFKTYNPFVYVKNFYDTNFDYAKNNLRRNQIESSVALEYEQTSKFSDIQNNNNNLNEKTTLIVKDIDNSVIVEKRKIGLLHEKRIPPSGIRILSLDKAFTNNNGERIQAVNDINVDISKNESFGLLGPNGAGKTTLINLLSCQLKADSGYAKIGPFLIHSEMFIDSLYIKRMIGVCGQFDFFWEELTVFETVKFFGKLKGIRSEHLLNQKIVSFGLKGKENEKVSKLSGGMRRRVSLLLATLGDPYIIYLDEPTTGLDPVNKRKIWKIINELKKDRVLLLSTQNIEEADYLCDRIGVMINGKLSYIGTSSDILKTNSYGYELQITIDLSKVGNTESTILDNNVKSVFYKSNINYSPSGIYRILIKEENKHDILKAMEMLNKKSKDEKMVNILKYTKEAIVTQANLEKCFIDLCNKFK